MGTLHIGGGTYKNPIKPKKPKKKKHTDKPKNQAGGSRVGGGAGSYKGSTGKVSSPKHKSATQKGGLGASTTQFLHSAAAHQQVSKSNAAYKVSNSKTSPLTTSHKYKLHTTGSGSTGASYKATSPKGLSKAEAKANADALAKQNKGSQHYTTTKNDSGKGVGGTDFSKAVLNSEGNTKSSSNLLGKSANVYTAKETSDHTARTSKAGKTNYYVNGTFDKNGKFNEGSKKSPTVTKVNKKTYDTVLAREGGDQSLGMTGRLAGNIASHAKSSVMSTAGAADRMTSSKANTYTYTDKNGTAHKAVSTGQLTLGQQAKPQKAQRTQIKKNYVSKAKRVEKSQNNLALEYAKQANYKKGQSALGRLALDTTGQMTEMGIDYLAGAVVAGTAGAVVGRALASAIGANGALTNMGLRSFTGGYDQAIADGATEKEANVFGWINAATEVATEKMWNVGSGFEKLYGKGVMNLDKFIPTASGRFVKSKTGKEIVSGLKTLGLSGGTEALEEIVGNGIEDSLAYVTYQKQIGERDMKALDSDVAMLEKNMGGSLPNNLKNDAIKAGQTGKEVDLKAIQAKYGDRAAAMYEQYMNAGSAHTKAEEYSHMDWKGMVKDQLNSALIAGLSGILMGGGSVASTYSQGRTINEDKNAKSSLYSAATQYGGAQSNRIVGRLQNQQAAGQEVSNMDTGKLAEAINSDISARRGSGTYKATQEIVNSHVKQADSVIAREYKTKSDTPNSDMNYHFGMSILESAADSGSYDANDYEPSLRQAKEVKDTATKAYLDMVIPDMNGNVSEDAKKSAEIVADAAAAISTGHASTDEIMLFGTSNPENRKVLESTLGIKLPTQDAATYAVLSQRNADSKIMFAKQDSNFTTARDIDEAFDLPGEAQAFNKTVKSAGKRDITQLTDYFNMFYHAGMAGRTRADAQAKFSKLSPLTSQEEFSAWYAGKKAHAYGDTAAPAKSSEPKGKSVQAKKTTPKKGKYTVDKDVTEADKKKVPAAFARLAKLISKKYHVDIVLMHEIKTDGGTKVNGAHTGNTIMIAANQADTTHILEGTLMHELTHQIESLAPAEYEKMKKYVMKHWRANNKVSFEYAVSNKMSQYKGTDTVHGKKDAIDEIMAEWAVSILQDEKAVREFLGYDATLGQKITDAIKKFLEEFTAYIKSALGATSPAYLKASGVEAEFKKLWLGAAKAAESGTASEKTKTSFSVASTLRADLQAILDDTFDASKGEVLIGDTSIFLVEEIGAEPNDVTMPPNKAWQAMVSEDDAKTDRRYTKPKKNADPRDKIKYHDLGADGLVKAVKAAEKPIMAYVSAPTAGNERENRIVIVTGEKDKNGDYIVVVNEVDTNSIVKGKRFKSNKIITTFGRSDLKKQIADANAHGRILYADKKRSHLVCGGTEHESFSSRNYDFTDNINNFWANVNYLKGKNTKLSTGPEGSDATVKSAMHKPMQLKAIKDSNAIIPEPHTGIRNEKDIKTFEEALADKGYAGDNQFTPDWSRVMAKKAMKEGNVTVYSSYPIEQGTFVTPSKIEAESYAGNGNVYQKVVAPDDVAWIDIIEGQYAKVKYSLPTDADYLSAVKRGDVAAAQKMVDEAAKKAGYGTRGYHGSRESFTVFSHKDIYGGKSNSIAGIGFWFTPSKSAAQNWTDQAWWGKGESQVYDSYLKINNPKVYETTVDPDKETKIQDIYDKLDVIEEKAKKLYDKHKYDMEEAYIFSEVSLRRNKGKADDILESKKVSFGSEEYDALKKDVTSYVEYKNEIDRLTDESLSYHYSDAYEKFKTDVYKLAGMNAEDANFGGMSRAIEGGVEQYRDKLKENLKKQGYDGMVIKNTKFDADTMGERNTQYVVFDPEQIKSADPVTYDDNGNVIPLSQRFNSEKDDIRFSLPTDAGYLSTVKRGDMTAAQRMVDEAAKEAGYSVKGYHGTPDGGFNVFDSSKSDFTDNPSIAVWFSDNGAMIGKYYNVDNSNSKNGKQLYECYLKIDDPLTIDASEKAWNEIEIPNDLKEDIASEYYNPITGKTVKSDTATTEEIAQYAKKQGYDGVIIKNVRDGSTKEEPGDIYAVFDPEQIKSADPVTYDDNGNVIPLSQRFNSEKDDIRFSLPAEDSEGKSLTDDQQNYFSRSKVRLSGNRLAEVYHTTSNGGFTIFDTAFSDDKTSLFFTDDFNMSASYANGHNDITEMLKDNVNPKELENTKGYYVCYLNLTNPLEIDCNGAEWDDIPEQGIAELIITRDDGSGAYDMDSAELGPLYYVSYPYDGLDNEGMRISDIEEEFGEDAAEKVRNSSDEEVRLYRNYNDSAYDEFTEEEPESGNTRHWCEVAKANGYDGVIFNDLKDNGLYGNFDTGNVYVAFDSNQVKSIYNEHPTIDDDIRYSVASYSDLRNKNIAPETRIPYTENSNYIAVSRGDYDALTRLQDEVKALPRGSYTNKATGYTANIIGETIKKALHPTSNNLNEYTKSYTDNLNGVVKLPGLFENAVYVDTIPTGKGKETNPQMKGYHHFVAPLYMNDTTYRALITAREKQNSDTLYVLRVEIMPNIKGTASRNTVSVGSGLRAVPSDISIADLVKNVKIYDYNKGTFNTYNGDDISFSAADDQKLTREQETRKLAATVERLRGEMKLTHNAKPNKADIRREANYLCKFYVSNVPVQNVENGLTEMYEILSRGNGAQKELSNADMDEFSRYAMDIAEDIVKHGGFVTDEGSEELAAAKEYFKGNHYYIPADLAADVGYKNYTEFRKLMFGYGVYVTKNEALNYPSFDGQMIEFEQEAPGMFPKGSTHTTTANVLDYTINEVLKPDTEKFVGYDVYSDEGQSVIVDIAEHIADTLELINPKRTFADRKKAEQNRAVARTNKKWKEREAKHKAYYLDKIGAMRVQMTAKLSEERAKNREKTAELKAKHKQEKADIRDKNREQISSMREKHALEKRAIREKDTEKYKNKVAALNEKSRIEKKAIRDKHTDLKNRKANIESIKGSADYLTKALLSPSDNIHLPMGYEAGIARVLYGIDFETHRMDKYAEKHGISRNVATFRRLESEYKSMIAGESENGPEADGIILDVGLPDIIERLADKFDSETETLGRVRLENMDSHSLADLRKLMSALRMSIQHINSTFYGEQRAKVAEQGEAVISELANLPDDMKGAAIHGTSDFLSTSNAKPIDFFERMGSPTLMRALNNIIEAQDTSIRHFRESMNYIETLTKSLDLEGSDVYKWHGARAEIESFKLSNGKTAYLTVGQKMELYALMQRKQAVGHILGSGIEIESQRYKGSKIKSVPKVRTRITYEETMKIIKSLTPEQRAFADSVLNFLQTTCAEWGNETSRSMFGYEKFGESNYYPIHTSRNYIAETSNPAANTPKLINGGAAKATVIGANNPIVIGDFFNTVTTHIDFMTQYNAFVPALTDIERLLNYTSKDEATNLISNSVKSMIDEKYGKSYNHYIRQLLSDINTKRAQDNDFRGVDKLLRWMKANALALNLRVLVQQPTSIARANYYINAKYLMQSAAMMKGFSKKETKRMWDICPLAFWKHLGFAQTDISRPLNDILFNRNNIYKKLAFDPYGAADDVTWRTIFGAVELETKAKMKKGEFNFKYDDAEYRKHVNERCRYIFDRTQVVDTTLHRAQIMRHTNPLVKSVTSFMSEPLTNWNMLLNCLSEARKLKRVGKTGDAIKLLSKGLTVYLTAGITLSLTASLISAMRQTNMGGDDEKRRKKRFIEQWLGKWGLDGIDITDSYLWQDIKSNMNPVYWLPIVGDAVDEFMNKYTDGRVGFTPNQQYLQLFDVLATGLKDTRKLIDGSYKDTKNSKGYYLQQVAESLSAAGGISIKNARRDAEALARAFVWGMGSKDYANYLYDRAYLNPEKNKSEVIGTYLSLQSKDKDHAKDMYKWMTKGGITKDDIRSYVRTKYSEKLEKAVMAHDVDKVKEIMRTERKYGIDTDTIKQSIKTSISDDYKKTFENNDIAGRHDIDKLLRGIGYSKLQVKSHRLAYAKGYSRYKCYLVYRDKGYDACLKACEKAIARYPGIYQSGSRMVFGIKNLTTYSKKEYDAGKWSPYSPSGKYSYANVNKSSSQSSTKSSGKSSSGSSSRHYSSSRSSGNSSRSSSSRSSSGGSAPKAKTYYSTATKSYGESSVRRAVRSGSRKTALSLARTYITKYGTVKYADAEAMVEAMEKETETDDQKLAKKYGLWG